ncbi:MAG: hypothetical protein JNL97_00515 [Verrucomicrobiales bacterium]|nr:hypothetical protein [Verrucomicrobiales bacterium]
MKMPNTKILVAGILASSLFQPAFAAVDFVKDVVPILRTHCIECHGAEKQKAKLRLDTKADLLKGGKSGEIVKAGNAAASDFHKRVVLPKDNDDRMPPEGEPLSAEKAAILEKWINEGLNWPDGIAILGPSSASPAPSPAPAAAAASNRPAVPAPELPKDFKPSPAEATAIAALAKNGVDVRSLAQNSPWREVNLRPQGASITDASIADLKDVGSLVELRLGGTKITDASLAMVKSFPHLQVLGLELTGITDAGVAHVAALSNLTSLNLYGTAVTDASLAHLQGLKHLRNVYLWQTKVTPEGVQKLQAALPGLNINTGIVFTAASTNAPAEKTEAKK